MSDNASLPWQRWQPNDLASLDRPLIEELVLPDV
ncbi:MAG TPA: flagellar assembly protein FliH, partial [Erwinia persicina]|nr:flagellar assembly protein FliH [Erwinia persicina]